MKRSKNFQLDFLEQIVPCKCALCGGFGTRFESMGYDPRNSIERHSNVSFSVNTPHDFFALIDAWFYWQLTKALRIAKGLTQ